MAERPENEKLTSGNQPVVKREIGSVSYSVTRLGWWGMLDALNRLEKLASPALEAFLDVDAADIASILEAQGGSVARGIALLIARATDDDGQALLKILGERTMIETDGRKVWLTPEIMDVWFSQHPDQAIEWIVFCLEVQFRDFFERPMRVLGKKIGAKPAAMMTTALSSQTT